MTKGKESVGKVIMIGCFDTKAEVFHYLYQHLIGQGCEVTSINTGIFGSTDLFPVTYENHWLLNSVGSSLEDVKVESNRNNAVALMSKAARKLIGSLSENNEVNGVIGMGGGGGTYIVLNAMQDVPFGIPKICLSTLATKDVTHLVGIKDVILMPSIVDVSGLNSIISVLIQQAAVAMGALSKTRIAQEETKKRVAISMFGNTTACVDACTALLQEKGFEVYAFHANGSGGRTMEELIRGGYFDGLLDITTTELADDLCGGICSAGPERAMAASSVGIPQIVVPGCLDMVNFGSIDTVPAQFRNRNLYSWSPDVTLMRTNSEENEILGQRLVERIKVSSAPVMVMIPRKGLSQIDTLGNEFYDGAANETLFDTIDRYASADLPVVHHELHINDPEFSRSLVEAFIGLLAQSQENQRIEMEKNSL